MMLFKILILQRYYNPTQEQWASNTVISRIRAMVEHVFGFMENSMGGMVIRSIGLRRASAIIGHHRAVDGVQHVP